jgi:hypothetical protein
MRFGPGVIPVIVGFGFASPLKSLFMKFSMSDVSVSWPG